MLTVASQLVDVTPVGHRTVQVDAAWAPNSMVYSISLAVATKDAIADAGTLAKLNSVSLDLEISATIMRGTVLAGQNNACQHNPCPTVPDCGCKSSCKIRHLFNSCKFTRQGMFDCSKDRCGCSGAYFDECVGFEYGTAGMQSCVGRILDDSNSNDEAPGKPGV